MTSQEEKFRSDAAPLLRSKMTHKVINMPTITDHRGSLISIEPMNQIPFEIKRIFYIFNNSDNQPRGMHAHRGDKQFLFCPSGSVSIHLTNGIDNDIILLDSPEKGLLVETMVWLEMHNFSEDCSLMVISSEMFNESDYIRDYDSYIREVRNEI